MFAASERLHKDKGDGPAYREADQGPVEDVEDRQSRVAV